MFSLNILKSFNGVILYKGESQLNDKPIVCIAVGLHENSKNRKTKDFIQVYVLSDEEEKPTDALGNLDESICGDCIHRQWRTCYVNHGPNAVYKSYKKGNYPFYEDGMIDLFHDRLVRLGAYGDITAVPMVNIQRILTVSAGWTGYTHQWRKKRFQIWKNYLMASVETTKQLLLARKYKWKTFRVRTDEEILEDKEFECPANKDEGITCENCLACHGGEWNETQYTPSIKIHGAHFKVSRFNKMQKLMRNKKRYRNIYD